MGADPASVLLPLMVALLWMVIVQSDPWKEQKYDDSKEYELDDSWYNSAELPDVDLEGLVHNLSQKISWFKYVGNATLECSNRAKQEDTLMMAIENLHGCLERRYQECASEFANETGCMAVHDTEQPCGTFRMGFRGTSANDYLHGMECRWYLTVPENFQLNLTVDEFWLESSGKDCLYDWVMIYDGHDKNNASAARWGKFCGRLPRFTLYATGKYMLIEAQTDGSIGKVGFRGVYQVMDAGIGKTGVDPTRFDFQDSGSFELGNNPWVTYDTYYTAYYYWYWHIRVQWGQLINLTLEHDQMLNNDSIEIFEGPYTRNLMVDVIGNTRARIYKHQSKGFLLLVRLRRRFHGDNVTTPDVRGSFSAVWADLMRLKESMDKPASDGCISYKSKALAQELSPKADFMLDESMTEENPGKITVPGGRDGAYAIMKPPGRPILCHWEITAPQGYFAHLKVTSLEVNAPNGDRCNYEGLKVWNGGNMSTDTATVGPFCYHEPHGLFTGQGVQSIVSSGRKLWAFYYSYQGYDYKDIRPRGTFAAYVFVTRCQGLWDPCERDLKNPLLPNYVKMTSEKGTDKSRTVHVDCKKEECCFIQQYPLYGALRQPLCKIYIGSQGPAHIATSKIETRLVIPDKNDSELQFACEIQQELKDLSDKVGKGSTHPCRGTNVLVELMSTSKFSMLAMSTKIEASECGFYIPALHQSNKLYPPCAQAEIPLLERTATTLTTKTYDIEFIAHKEEPNTTYEFKVDWDMTDILRKDKCDTRVRKCISDTIALHWGDKDAGYSIQWTDVKKIPLLYRGWWEPGWKRTLKVTRNIDKTCLQKENRADENKYNTTACRLLIDFKAKPFDQGLPSFNPRYSCPDRYDKLGKGCYQLIWPSEKGKPLPEGYSMNIREAREKCKQNDPNSDLLSLHFKRELDDIRLHMYYEWWESYLRYIPGHKVFALGAEFFEDINRFKWSTGEPVTYAHWNIPDYKRRDPDKATGRYKPDEVLPSVRPRELEEELGYLQPRNPRNGDCTVMVAASAYKMPYWVKTKCDLQIPNLMPICEVPAISNQPKTDLDGELEGLKAIKDLPTEEIPSYRTDIEMDAAGNHKLVGTKYECPPEFTMVGDKCLAVYVKGTGVIGSQWPGSSCKEEFKKAAMQENVTGAEINDDYTELISSALRSWLVTKNDGRIRVRKGLGSFKGGDTPTFGGEYCSLLEPTEVWKEGLNRTQQITYTLTDSGSHCGSSEQDRKNVYGALCEARPVLSMPDVCHEHHHRCGDGMCIHAVDVCDGVRDCLAGDDEQDCSHVCTLKDGFRADPSKLTSGSHCFTPECSKENCTCNELYFQCRSGGCIAATKVCDYVENCADGSDEELCRKCAEIGDDGKCKSFVATCPAKDNVEQYRCDNSQCIDQKLACDFKPDCIDGSDEMHCNFDLKCSSNSGHWLCDNGKCIPNTYVEDGYPDCPAKQTDENRLRTLHSERRIDYYTGSLLPFKPKRTDMCLHKEGDCHSDMKDCVDRKDTCVYRRDGRGQLIGCRLGQHLNEDCKYRICAGMYKCPNSYCIPLPQVCDGVNDCMGGEDEKKCNNLYCPGMYKCKGTNACIRYSQICDETVDCALHHDDEALCVYGGEKRKECPAGCSCFGQAISCLGRKYKNVPGSDTLFTDLRALILRKNEIYIFMERKFEAKKLFRFDLSYNRIQGMGETVFKGLRMLRELYLHNNELSSISREFFTDLHYLEKLTLYHNEISHITMDAFTGLKSLPELDLSHQQLRTLEDYHFAGLDSIEILNISHNRIQSMRENCFSNKRSSQGEAKPFYKLKYLNIEGNSIAQEAKEAFQYLPPDTHLISDRFKYCCYARHVRKCDPAPDEFSSCEDLLASRVLRVAVWAIGLLAFAGNICVLHQRMKHERETTPSLLVQHLAFSDAVMGVYVLIIAGADQYFKGHYIDAADDWRTNALCKLAGFLSMLSCEMSVYLLMLITVDRMYATVPSLNSTGIGVRGVRGLIALGWTFAAILSVVPILEFNYFGSGYIRSGVCTLFNLTEGMHSGWEFTMAVYVGFNTISILVMAVGYFRAYKSYMDGVEDWPMAEELTDEEKEAEIEFRKNEMIITRRLILMVLTDIAIWMPLILVGVGTFLGLDISKPLAAWITMFFMPLNAAINPYLYTFSTQPHRIPIDDLLRNWTETEYDDEDEFDQAGRFEADLGASGLADPSLIAKAAEKQQAEKGGTEKPPINPEKPPII